MLFFVPVGTYGNSPAIYRWDQFAHQHRPSAKPSHRSACERGRNKAAEDFVLGHVPQYGKANRSDDSSATTRYPAINRWAIIKKPTVQKHSTSNPRKLATRIAEEPICGALISANPR